MDQNKFNEIINRNLSVLTQKDIINILDSNIERLNLSFKLKSPSDLVKGLMSTSVGIRTGYGLEEVVDGYIEEICGGKAMNTNIEYNGEMLDIDIFRTTRDDRLILVEQKIRDDHDRRKYLANIDDFTKKIEAVRSVYHNSKALYTLYFVDDNLTKNKNKYLTAIKGLRSKYNSDVRLFYGRQLFEYLGNYNVWPEFILYFNQFRDKYINDDPKKVFKSNFEDIRVLTYKVCKILNYVGLDIKNELRKEILDQDTLWALRAALHIKKKRGKRDAACLDTLNHLLIK